MIPRFIPPSALVAVVVLIVLVAYTTQAQPSGDVPMPVLLAEVSQRVRVVMAPDGNDSGDGTRERPLSTFGAAIARLKALTAGEKGRVACEIRFLPGRYALRDVFIQYTKDYVVSGAAGERRLDVSFVGEGNVTLDAAGVVVPAGHGVITTSSCGIEIRNIRIVNSNEFGIRLGTSLERRSTNILLSDVTVDSTFSHGVRIGEDGSPLSDTVALVSCSITHTNLMNDRGMRGQFGSALKLFGARDVNVIECKIGRNWGEAVCINNSSRVRVRRCTIYDNWAPGVYCDVGSDVVVEGCTFRSDKDTTMFPAGRRGMVAVLISTEGWAGSPNELRCQNIDIINNVFVNMAGCLDIWEGAIGFTQQQIISGIRFAHNTCVGMWTTKGNTSTAFVNLVYSVPFPNNRQIRNVLIANNIFSVDPTLVAPNRWIRLPAEAVLAMTYPSNHWSASVPGIATTFGNIVAPSLPLTEPASWLPEVTPSLRGRVPRLSWVASDAGGRTRGSDSTNVGAYELALPSSVSVDVEHASPSVWPVVGASTTVCAPGRRVQVLVCAVDGRMLTAADLDRGECRMISWPAFQPVLVMMQ
ncbi:MAG: right-handed parallel beta-helix repeat-containing protein [Bacteroidota bacterium]|jgi:hypothetical protein